LEHTTKQTDIVGTYAWMAPEVRGSKHLNRSSLMAYHTIISDCLLGNHSKHHCTWVSDIFQLYWHSCSSIWCWTCVTRCSHQWSCTCPDAQISNSVAIM